MSDPKQGDSEREPLEDDHELTFERGYGAQEKVLAGQDLADVAGVTEEDVREDMLEGQKDAADGE